MLASTTIWCNPPPPGIPLQELPADATVMDRERVVFRITQKDLARIVAATKMTPKAAANAVRSNECKLLGAVIAETDEHGMRVPCGLRSHVLYPGDSFSHCFEAGDGYEVRHFHYRLVLKDKGASRPGQCPMDSSTLPLVPTPEQRVGRITILPENCVQHVRLDDDGVAPRFTITPD